MNTESGQASFEFVESVQEGKSPSRKEALALLGTLVVAARKERNYSQALLARDAGLPQTTVSKLEAGGTSSAKAITAVCRVLEIEVPAAVKPYLRTRSGRPTTTARKTRVRTPASKPATSMDASKSAPQAQRREAVVALLVLVREGVLTVDDVATRLLERLR